MKKLLINLLMCVVCTSLFGQNISGTLKDSAKNEAASYINLALLHQQDSSFVSGTVSDAMGNYKIENPDTGKYILRVTGLGYKPEFLDFAIENKKEYKVFNFTLKDAAKNVEEVVILADKPVYKLEGDKRVYLAANDASVQTVFATDALQNVTGVNVELSGAITLRGTSVSIWINGKPTTMWGEQLKIYLQNLSASQIEKIEAYTNPGAKFTASNTQGVINIVLKKKLKDDQLFSIGTVISNNPVAGIWASYYKTTKKWEWNFYTMFSYVGYWYKNTSTSWKNSEADTSFYSHYSKEIKAKMCRNNEMYATATYNVNEKTSITGTIAYMNSIDNSDYTTSLLRKFQNPYNFSSYMSYNTTTNASDFQLSFNHQFNDKGTALTIDFSNAIYVENSKNVKNYNFYSENYKKQRFANAENVSLYSNINTVLTLPISEKCQFETGFLLNLYQYQYIKYLTDTFSTISNKRAYSEVFSRNTKENKPSVEPYINLAINLKKWNMKFGLRYEYYEYNFSGKIPDNTINKRYPNFYPSANLTYNTEKGNSISLSYSRRVQNPLSELNPYMDYSTDDYIATGNPNLKFAGTNSYELGFFRDFKGKVQVTGSVYHRFTKNDIASVYNYLYNDFYKRNMQISTYANAARNSFTGTELDINCKLSDKLKLRLYYTGCYTEISGNYEGYNFSDNAFVSEAKLALTAQLSKVQLQIREYYSSEGMNFMQKSKGYFFTSIRINADLLKKKLSASLSIRDIFESQKQVSEFNSPELHRITEEEYRFRNIQFALAYRFGNVKYANRSKSGGEN